MASWLPHGLIGAADLRTQQQQADRGRAARARAPAPARGMARGPAAPPPLARRAYDYRRLVYAPARQHIRNRLREIHDTYLRSPEDWEMDKTLGTRVLSKGDEVVAGINRTLDSFKMKRASHQIEFHDQFTRSCLPKIYPDWDTNYDSILKRYKLSQVHMETLIVCPRRFGKTIAVSMYVAAYMMNVPNSEVSIFSTGRRTAGKLMQSVIKFLQELPGFEEHIKVKNYETLVLDFGNGDTRTMSSYPGTVAVRPHPTSTPIPHSLCAVAVFLCEFVLCLLCACVFGLCSLWCTFGRCCRVRCCHVWKMALGTRK